MSYASKKGTLMLKIMMLSRAKEDLESSLAALKVATPYDGRYRLESYVMNAVGQIEWCLERTRIKYRQVIQSTDMMNTDEEIEGSSKNS